MKNVQQYLDRCRRMRRHWFIAVLAISMIALFDVLPASALTTVPTKMNFQGRLADSSGNIKPNGTYNMRLKLYTAASGGSPVWTEDRLVSATQGVTVTNGLFSIQLGSITSLPASLFASGGLYLEVELPSPATATSSSPTWSEGPMTPRNQMATSAYAYNAETLDGLDSASFGQLGVNNVWSGSNTFNGNFIVDSGSDISLIANSNLIELISNQFSVNTASSISLDSADIALAGSGGNGTVTIGTADTSATILVLDTKNTAGDPTGINGAMYYNSGNGKFRCYENGAWKDCDTTGSGGITSGSTASRPASPSEGTVYFDTTTKQLLTYANGKWQADRSNSTKIVAASNSTQAAKDSADYVADGNGGGAGDGDQVQINAALTAATGGKVYLLEGTYTVDATIMIPNNTSMIGSGAGTVVEAAFGATSDNIIENSDTTTGTAITISDLKIDGRRDLSTGNVYLVFMTGVGGVERKGLTLTRTTLVNTHAFGLRLDTAQGAKISHNDFFDIDNAAVTANGSQHTFTENRLDGVGNITVYGPNGVVSSNIVTNSNGITVGGGAGSSVVNNTVTGSNSGLTLFDASAITITGNTFSGNTGTGVNSMDDTTLSQMTFSDNIVRNNGAQGMYLFYTTKSIISDNIFENNGGSTANDAIMFDGTNDDVSITGNTIGDTSATTTNYGIYITNGSNRFYLSGNILLNGSTISDADADTIYDGQLNASGQLVNASSGGTVSKLQPSSSADLYQGQNSTGTAVFKVASTGAIQGPSLDTIGATALALGTTNATAINLNQNTTLLAGKTLTIGTSSNGIVLTDTGYTLAGTARNSKRITLAAEYANSVLDAGTGSNNTGTMTAALDLTNRMNYYRWTTTQGTNQSYDVVVQVPIPSDFSAWASTTPITVSTRTSDLTNGLITIEARDTGGTVVSGINFASITPTATGTWQSRNAGTISGTYTAGGYMTLRLRLQSPNAGDVRIGNITMDYLSKW